MYSIAGPVQRLAGLWNQPLRRTSHLLVANSVLNAATGLGYWLLAARFNSPAVVGVSSAAFSAMMLLSGVTQLNLMSAILRFVPTAGAAAGRMIRRAYLIGGGLAGVAAIVFLIGLRYWAPNLAGLLHSPLGGITFVIATMTWSVFVMQDSALTAVGRPVGVPAENLAYSLLKIIMVAAFSLAIPGLGIWLSWTVAMFLAVGGTTAYLFGRAIPRFAVASEPSTVHVASLRELRRYIGPDYLGALAYLVSVLLTPLLVLSLTNPRTFAPYALDWQICVALYAVPIAFGQSLVAHGATNGRRLAQYHRQVLRESLQVLVPIVAIGVIIAPVGLRFFGSWYAQHGTVTLQFLALSALPNAVVALEVSRARVARQMRIVVTISAVQMALVLALTALLVPRFGITGGGIAWLGAQLVVVTGVVGRYRAQWIRSRLLRVGEAAVPRRVLAAALAAVGWQRERVLPTDADSTVLMVRAPDGQPGILKVAARSNGVASLRREHQILERLRATERLGDWRALLPLPLAAGELDGGAYCLMRRLPSQDAIRLAAEQASWLTPVALSAIAPLHSLAQAQAALAPARLRELVDEPADRLRRATGQAIRVDRLAAALRAQLEGRPVPQGWTHGDFWPGNILVSEDKRVAGIVDWGQARENDLTVLDIAFWLLTVSSLEHKCTPGAQVAARLGAERCWSPAESRVLAAHSGGAPVSERALLMLIWLRHVTQHLDESGRNTFTWRWARQNVLPVLQRVTDLNGGIRGWK